MTERVVLIELDNWQGLYIDGKLVYQDHRIEAYTLFKYVLEEGTWRTKWADNVPDTMGYLPEDLGEAIKLLEIEA